MCGWFQVPSGDGVGRPIPRGEVGVLGAGIPGIPSSTDI